MYTMLTLRLDYNNIRNTVARNTLQLHRRHYPTRPCVKLKRYLKIRRFTLSKIVSEIQKKTFPDFS